LLARTTLLIQQSQLLTEAQAMLSLTRRPGESTLIELSPDMGLSTLRSV
jgi:hypothetical protein